jgi:sterol carrier protein 2
MGYEAGVKAMLDAKITYDDVETGVACYCYGDTTSGQRIFYQFGMSGIPIYNTNNSCATGSTGLALARTLIKNGAVDCALVALNRCSLVRSRAFGMTDRVRWAY